MVALVTVFLVLCCALAYALARAAGRALKPRVAPVRVWFQWKSVCAWCKPMRRMRGNPFAPNVTHGMCERCQRAIQAELQRETDHKLRRILGGDQSHQSQSH